MALHFLVISAEEAAAQELLGVLSNSIHSFKNRNAELVTLSDALVASIRSFRSAGLGLAWELASRRPVCMRCQGL